MLKIYLKFNSFRNNIKTEKVNLQKAKQKFIDLKNQEIIKLEKEKEVWRDNIKIVDSLKCKESDILDLDIGGTYKITTTRSTLTKVKNYFVYNIIFIFFSVP